MFLENRTDGYRTIMTEVRMGDSGDPWGTVMDFLFAIAEVVYVRTGEVLSGFGPSPLMHPGDPIDEDDNYTALNIDSLLWNGTVTADDLRNAYTTLSRADDILRVMGHNY